MSYDLQIWSVDRPDIESFVRHGSSWTKGGDIWSLTKRDWRIAIGESDTVLPEDIPEEISAAIPGIAYLTELNLQPISAPDSAKKMLSQAANALAKMSHGIVYNCQTDELTTPRGIRRFASQARSERFAILELGWWFLGDSIFSSEALTRLLTIFEALLPEALPRRYGLYEPPQHLLVDKGRDHLLSFLLENLDDSPVLYTSRPVVGMSVSFTKEHYHPRLGFRANRLSVECEASAIDQPGWQEGLRRFWLAVCANLSPFYSDVRTLNGFVRMGGTYGSDMETDVHPIRSWFWRGVPRELGHALAIGEPYVDLWRQASTEGESRGDLLVLDSGNWTEGNNLKIKVPEGISQSWTPRYQTDGSGSGEKWVDKYPTIWPF